MPEGRPFYSLDIETDTSPVSEGERARGFSDRGLDPRITRITALSIAKRDTSGSIAASVWTGDEATILADAQSWLQEQEPGVIVTWNGSVFDFPFIDFRARSAGLPLDLSLVSDPRIVPKYQSTPGYAGGYSATWAGHTSADLAYAVRSAALAAGVVWSLKPFARSVGLNPVEVDRERMHELSPSELEQYVASDAVNTLLVGERASDLLAEMYPNAF